MNATRLAIVLAAHFGLVALIARGCRGLAYLFLGIFVLPVMTLVVWQLRKRRLNTLPPTVRP